VAAVSTRIAVFIDLFRSPSKPGTNNPVLTNFSVASLLIEWSWARILPSEKRQCFWCCSGWWCQVGQGGGYLALYHADEPEFYNDVLVFDTPVRRIDRDSDRSTVAAADYDVYVEYSLQSLSPGHGVMALNR
jgi:hypothetical protein